MITNPRVILPVFLLFQSITVAAGETSVYRCIDAQGLISFQVHQCESIGEQITVHTTKHGWVGLRAEEQALLASYRAAETGSRKSKQSSKQKIAQKGESKACFSKRHRLGRVRDKLRHGYKPTEGMRLRSQRDEYEQYLNRFCF